MPCPGQRPACIQCGDKGAPFCLSGLRLQSRHSVLPWASRLVSDVSNVRVAESFENSWT